MFQYTLEITELCGDHVLHSQEDAHKLYRRDVYPPVMLKASVSLTM